MKGMVCCLVGAQADEDTRAKMEEVMRKHADFAVDAMNYYFDSNTLAWEE